MKSDSLRYLMKEGLRNLWVNRLMSLASIGVLMSCLILIGSASMLFLNINVFMDRIEDQNVVMMFVKKDAGEAATAALQSRIQKISNVAKVEFVPKEVSWEQQLNNMGESNASFLKGLNKENPLPDAYKVTLKDMNSFDKTLTELQKVENIDNIRENKDLAQKMVSLRHGLTIISVSIIGILFAVSLFIISNTIKLTMYSRRLEINIMKSVGATNAFVRFPFVVEGMLLGATAGLISLAAVFGVYQLAVTQFDSLFTSVLSMQPLDFGKVIWPMLGVFLLIGLLSGVGGSWISMNKYLKKEGSEISEI